jgi:hypothetical protein
MSETKTYTLDIGLGKSSDTFPIYDREKREERAFYADPMSLKEANALKRVMDAGDEEAAQAHLAGLLDARKVKGATVTPDWVQENVPANAVQKLYTLLATGKADPNA